ncbi:unnamed protein product [Thelazia callipaeda]|uniref:Ovule protein n=1 Tax=Thelazia callipaeda TaxID=103827 RepID=A0A0N5CY90_THECL|nr:unnamed protein product [Thelazia callipaeda]
MKCRMKIISYVMTWDRGVTNYVKKTSVSDHVEAYIQLTVLKEARSKASHSISAVDSMRTKQRRSAQQS